MLHEVLQQGLERLGYLTITEGAQDRLCIKAWLYSTVHVCSVPPSLCTVSAEQQLDLQYTMIKFYTASLFIIPSSSVYKKHDNAKNAGHMQPPHLFRDLSIPVYTAQA